MRIYADTSVFGGVFDEQFAVSSQRFLDYVKQGRYVILLSVITYDELQGAPEHMRQLIEEMPAGSYENIVMDQEIIKLAEAYISAGALGPTMENDALHVASATVARADAILSWNFKHIVNFDRILKFNGVNIMNGYPQIPIHSPLEMAYDDEN
jgi:hypothetical protein